LRSLGPLLGFFPLVLLCIQPLLFRSDLLSCRSRYTLLLFLVGLDAFCFIWISLLFNFRLFALADTLCFCFPWISLCLSLRLLRLSAFQHTTYNLSSCASPGLHCSGSSHLRHGNTSASKHSAAGLNCSSRSVLRSWLLLTFDISSCAPPGLHCSGSSHLRHGNISAPRPSGGGALLPGSICSAFLATSNNCSLPIQHTTSPHLLHNLLFTDRACCNSPRHLSHHPAGLH